ncbi:CDP-diacylglycerol--serine O-phosphatidyltransferase [Telmatospirillum sp. J64-1]|uniref:CDP-diacylglycerol--serine O-phosphatidyltransferase n=1 Tax=Telmatospirillum sp. J64-1 TaxID=2502183 RepID=UPI00115E4101|nr:CDP-diacylglycerol--serine O-phosphatidyltransferase [Telmatospirillum sp. J64-1]
MFRPRPVPRIKGLSFNRMIPNILTLLALSAGLTSIRFGMHDNWQAAVVAILIAAILDGLDGRVARMLRGTSKFGAELDSLADFISFGVAPAVLLYFWIMHTAGGIGWALVLLFAICSALRLARFNTMIGQPDMPPWAYNFFTGVPAPAAGGLVLIPMMLSFEAPGFFAQPVVVGIFLVGVSFLMVSSIPTFSGKSFKVPHSYVLPLMVVIGLLAAFLVTEPWLTVSVLGFIYLATIPISVRRFRKLSRQAEKMMAAEPAAATDETPKGEEPPK